MQISFIFGIAIMYICVFLTDDEREAGLTFDQERSSRSAVWPLYLQKGIWRNGALRSSESGSSGPQWAWGGDFCYLLLFFVIVVIFGFMQCLFWNGNIMPIKPSECIDTDRDGEREKHRPRERDRPRRRERESLSP